MRFFYLAVGRIRLDHHLLHRNVLQHRQVFLSFEAAAIDANVKIQFQYLIQLSFGACERMDDSCGEAIPIFCNDVVEIIPRVPVVQVHREFVLFGKCKVVGEHLQLLLFSGPLESIIIKAALSDSNQVGHFGDGRVDGLEILLNTGPLVLVEWLLGPARVHSDRGVTVGMVGADLGRLVSILEVACCYEQMLAPILACPFNNFLPIVVVGLLVVILA